MSAANYDPYEIPSYARFPFSIVSGAGLWVTTASGERFLDFYGGHAVCSTGHCHPRVVAAIQAQAAELLFYSNLVHLPIRAAASAALAELCPPGLEQVFFVNSGTEANENALKIAMRLSGRQGVLGFGGGFHGRTVGSLSATALPKYRSGQHLLDEHHFVPFGDSQAAAEILKTGKIGAVILEPIQSMAGCRTAPPSFFQDLRAICTEFGSYLIYDEVQTGMGRTGSPFFAGKYGVTPDLISLGKGLASGVPMGAVVCHHGLGEQIKPGDLGTTFGGGPLAAAAMLATIAVLRDESLWDNAARLETYLRNSLAGLPLLTAIHGQGLLLGLEFSIPAKEVQQALLGAGIITGLAENPQILRLLPPLTLTEAACVQLVSALKAAVAGFIRSH